MLNGTPKIHPHSAGIAGSLIGRPVREIETVYGTAVEPLGLPLRVPSCDDVAATPRIVFQTSTSVIWSMPSFWYDPSGLSVAPKFLH